MEKNVKNFINSKDAIYFGIPCSLVCHCSIIIFCLVDILLYLFNCDYLCFKGTLFGFVFAIVIASIDLINIIVRICMPKEKIQYAYYGICSLLISLYFNYAAFRLGLLPFSQMYGLLAIGVWVVVSIICIYGIKDNIINDRYNRTSDSTYYFKEQKDDGDGKKYGVVVTKYTLLGIGIYIIVGIIFSLVSFVITLEKFYDGATIAQKYAHLLVMICSLILSCWANFAWKLVIKQFYLNKK